MIQIDMPMPDSCSECRFETKRGFCKAMPDNFCGYTNDVGRPEWCPLKEQEPMKPTWSQGKAYCGNCGHGFPRKRADMEINYCGYCGQAVKWE